MGAWQAALWGLLGGAVAEALAFYKLMQPRTVDGPWHLPWQRKADRPVILLAMSFRSFVSFGLPLPLFASHQLPTPMAAFITGLAAPLLLSRIFEAIPVADAPVPAPSTLDLAAAENEAAALPRGARA